jgi:hypothetical protein
MDFGVESSFGFGGAAGGGSGPSTPTIQFMWVVGGPSNFGSPPVAGDTVFTNSNLTNVKVRVSRGGLWQLGLNPMSGNSYYIKVTANSFLTFTPALVKDEEIIVETIPQ